jgi:hypothetical protein
MVKITLDNADNGTIKTITDDNSNGAGSLLEHKVVYDFEKDSFKRKIEFFYDIANDLGIDTGNAFDKNNIVMKLDWGKSYTPTVKEIQNKIKSLEFEIGALKLMLDIEDEITKEPS